MSYFAELLSQNQPYQLAADVPGDFPVSRHSHWSSPTWKYDAVTAGSRDVVMHWGFPVFGRTLFTEPKYSGMLEMARRFFWSVTIASQRGRNPKVTSLTDYFWALKSLLRWMAGKRLFAFSELTPAICREYLADKSDELDARGRNTANMVASYADTLCRIHEQSVLFKEVPDAVMALHPFGGQTAHDVSQDFAPLNRNGFLPPVPDAIFLASQAKALEWIDGRAADVLAIQELMIEARKNVDRHKSNSYSYHLNKILAKFRFDGGGTMLTPWRESLSPEDASFELRYLFNDLRDAGIIALNGTLGLRISEICGIGAGEMPDGALWPTCITASPSVSGLNEVFHLQSRLYKTTDIFENVKWLVGSRPMGSDYIPLPVRAITLLWKLFKPWRDLGNQNELIVSLGISRGFPWDPQRVDRILSGGLDKSQKSWVEAQVDVPRNLKAWDLSFHQWRKSFAIYMVRTDPRMLPAVRDHFKHMSVAMTESGYLGRDPELLGLLDDEGSYTAAKVLFEAANGRPGAGKMMDMIEQNRDSILSMIGTRGSEEDRIYELARLLKEDDVRVWPSEWGACFFMAERARCHHRAKGDFDQHARQPHYGQRRPGVCCACANLLVFSDDVEFWQARLKSGLAVLEANRAEGEHAAAAVAEDRVRSSVVILKRLGIEVDWQHEYTETEEVDEFA